MTSKFIPSFGKQVLLKSQELKVMRLVQKWSAVFLLGILIESSGAEEKADFGFPAVQTMLVELEQRQQEIQNSIRKSEEEWFNNEAVLGLNTEERLLMVQEWQQESRTAAIKAHEIQQELLNQRSLSKQSSLESLVSPYREARQVELLRQKLSLSTLWAKHATLDEEQKQLAQEQLDELKQQLEKVEEEAKEAFEKAVQEDGEELSQSEIQQRYRMQILNQRRKTGSLLDVKADWKGLTNEERQKILKKK